MQQKTYLRWPQKLAYGSGGLSYQIVNQFVVQFMMLFLTDSVGMDPKIVGTIMLVSNFLDGVTDVFFGSFIDRTRTKMGRARPWILFAQIGVSICVLLLFSIPASMGKTGKYVWFFITYNLLNAVFYTASNIAYSTLISLITKNNTERVQCGSIEFMFSTATSMCLAYAVVYLSPILGWNVLAAIFAVISAVLNTIIVFAVKELPEEELYDQQDTINAHEKPSMIEGLKLCLSNRYFVALIAMMMLMSVSGSFGGSAIYFFKYVMQNEGLYGTYNLFSLLPIVVGMLIVPAIVKRFGMSKPCSVGWFVNILARIGFCIAGFAQNFPLMMLFLAIYGFGCVPFAGTQMALCSEAATYTYYRSGKRIDAMIFACKSLGGKLGNGLGPFIYGLVLSSTGYVANAAQQTDSALFGIQCCLLIIPILIAVIVFIVTLFISAEKANRAWEAEHSIGQAE